MAEAWVLKDSAVRRGRGRPPRSAYIQAVHIREEMPYTDFHPDLDITSRLSIYSTLSVPIDVNDPALRRHEPIAFTKPSFRTRPMLPWAEGTFDTAMRKAGFRSQEGGFKYDTYIREEIRRQQEQDEERVEYDMDEQDDLFLQELNFQRKKASGDTVSRELFEVTMTRIESEWNTLEARIPRPKVELGAGEDSRCSICDDGECENSNAIVFCDGCNLAVHQDCYGVPYIPEGQWLCRKCHVAPQGSVSCVFCPNGGGAFKQTSTNRWAHLLCGIWIPETSVSNTVYMEPIDGAEKIPKSRWKLVCYICKQRMGSCIQCSNKTCFTAFHVTCARKAKLYVKTRGSVLDPFTRKAYCDKHVSTEWQHEHSTDSALIEAQTFYATTMGNRAWPDSQSIATTFPNNTPERSIPKITLTLKRRSSVVTRLPSGAPVIPRAILNTTVESINRIPLRKKKEFVQEMCKYWTLKRELRKGAALLKLKPRDIIGGTHKLTQRQGEKRSQLATHLRKDLDRLRNLVVMIRKREKLKLEGSLLQQQLLETLYFPVTPLLRSLLQKAMSLDKNELFYQVPDIPEYRETIETPMSWAVLKKNIDQRIYNTIEEFKIDIHLVFSNAATYNPADSVYTKTALRVQKQMQPEFEKAERDAKMLKWDSAGRLDVAKFDPIGMSVSEESWNGREAVRDLSPFSEIGDAEIMEMEDKSESPVVQHKKPPRSKTKTAKGRRETKIARSASQPKPPRVAANTKPAASLKKTKSSSQKSSRKRKR